MTTLALTSAEERRLVSRRTVVRRLADNRCFPSVLTVLGEISLVEGKSTSRSAMPTAPSSTWMPPVRTFIC